MQIMARIAPYKEAKPAADFKTWVSDAYFDRVNLSAQGFYITHDFGENYDWATNTGAIDAISPLARHNN